jgi:hypothetical protein
MRWSEDVCLHGLHYPYCFAMRVQSEGMRQCSEEDGIFAVRETTPSKRVVGRYMPTHELQTTASRFPGLARAAETDMYALPCIVFRETGVGDNCLESDTGFHLSDEHTSTA